MWKLIFDSITLRGIGCNREPMEGEFAIERQPSDCAWFNVYPERYQYVDGVFSEVPQDILDAEMLIEAKQNLQTSNKAVCRKHIISKYPLETQSSAVLGVYPAEVKEVMVSFIAACIAEENRVFDLVEAVTTAEELEAVDKPIWPEV